MCRSSWEAKGISSCRFAARAWLGIHMWRYLWLCRLLSACRLEGRASGINLESTAAELWSKNHWVCKRLGWHLSSRSAARRYQSCIRSQSLSPLYAQLPLCFVSSLNSLEFPPPFLSPCCPPCRVSLGGSWKVDECKWLKRQTLSPESDQAGNWESAQACQDARGRKGRCIYFHWATGRPGNSKCLEETETKNPVLKGSETGRRKISDNSQSNSLNGGRKQDQISVNRWRRRTQMGTANPLKIHGCETSSLRCTENIRQRVPLAWILLTIFPSGIFSSR